MSETGWGEFEVQVKIHFHDAAAEKPVTIYHVLKLFHSQSGDSQPTSSAVVQGRKTVVSEYYDEVVFQVSLEFLVTVHRCPSSSTLILLAGPSSVHAHATDHDEAIDTFGVQAHHGF